MRTDRAHRKNPHRNRAAALKSGNRSLLLHLLFTHPSLPRTALIRQSNLAPSTVSMITSELLDEGLIRRVGNAGRTGAGRPTDILARNPAASLAAAVHITPERCRIGIVDLGYNVLETQNLHFEGGFEEGNTGDVAAALRELVETGRSGRKLAAVALALPNYPYSVDAIRESFERAFPEVPVHRINNTEAMAVHEFYLRLGRELHSTVYVYVGTGIGSGLIINSSLYRGVHGDACDFGHMYLTDRPIVCRCGREGCLETVASERAISTALVERYNLSDVPVREELIEFLIARLAAHDDFCGDLLREAAEYLGKGIFNLVSITDPQRVIVAGRLTALGPLYTSLVQESYMRRARRFSPQTVPLEFVEVRDDSALIGGAMFSFISLYCGAVNPAAVAA